MNTTSLSASTTPRHNVSFGGIVRSEWVKLLSIPSTLWAYGIMAAITIGITAQISASTNDAWLERGFTQQGMQAAAAYAVSISTDLTVLVACVLGIVVIAGEYSTGTIRSTFTAVPQRAPVLLAKFLVFAVVTALVGTLAMGIAFPIGISLFAGNGIDVHLDDPHLWTAVVGSVGYLVAIGLISFAIGAILRNIVGGVTAAIGILFVLPIGLGFIAGVIESQVWLRNLSLLLPFNLGRALNTHPGYADFASPGMPVQYPEGQWVLEPWHGALGLAAWVAVLFTTAIVMLKRRDA